MSYENNVRTALKKHKSVRTLQRLADASGISLPTLYKVMRGEATKNKSVTREYGKTKIARILGVKE